ncbi:phospholactate guanylyltransferase [Halosimplex carlsbadense 2-9-1]|uniref:2-phospho-L-lactate guanylyltransferase n=1 Tax=Halosimplex carlsbadense 2-9-1 TaxID=797114 RepID=M0D852_9EURY|nr:2-phospho-L-lactate guanylyltransferase [Halosimplex carlsbadense]ELZ30339.1 phospholactate guanylyltransferase [Halosimplex carlsbadense 2-9-1]
MRVVVPFAPERPKTRLAPVLDEAGRVAFARTMLDDVLSVLSTLDRERGVPVDPLVLSTASVDCGAPVTVDDRQLTEAVNDYLPTSDGDDPVAVVMADLALVTPAALEGLFEPDADVVIAPGRGGGTNALVVRDPDFRVDYHGASVRDHRDIAREAGLSVAHVDSFRLATDVDEPADLVEVLLHGTGEAATWLREAGFSVVATDGRVDVERNSG